MRRAAHSRTWLTLPAPDSSPGRKHRLDRVHHERARLELGGVEPRSPGDPSRPGSRARARDAEPVRAELYLGRRLLARDVEDRGPRVGERAAGLEEQGGLADAGIASDENEGSGDDAAPQDAIQLADARGDALARGTAMSPMSMGAHRRRAGAAPRAKVPPAPLPRPRSCRGCAVRAGAAFGAGEAAGLQR